MDTIKDRVVVVTGGGGAIARAILAAFARGGARLAVVDRTLAHAHPAADAVGGLAIAADLATAEGAAAMARAVLERFGRVDGLVHTVGGFAMAPLLDGDAALYDHLFDLNVRTLFHALRAVVPSLVAQNGGFVCGFSSEPAWTGAAPGAALYAAAKSAVATLLRSLDGELRGTAVDVAIVYPMGAVDTEANRRAMPDVDPMTLIDPAEIAAAILFAATRGPRARITEIPIRPARRR